jgi:hypothetical protein
MSCRRLVLILTLVVGCTQPVDRGDRSTPTTPQTTPAPSARPLPAPFLRTWRFVNPWRGALSSPNFHGEASFTTSAFKLHRGEESKDSGGWMLAGSYSVLSGEGSKTHPYRLRLAVETASGDGRHLAPFKRGDRIEAQVFLDAGQLDVSLPRVHMTLGDAERCTVVATVEAFSASASHDSFDDGRTETHAGTTLKIVEPTALRGRKLVVLHDGPPSTDSPWRASKRSLRFTIERRLLQGKMQLFSGAASGVELVPP